MIMAENMIIEDLETGKVDWYCGCFKVKVLENNLAMGIDENFKNIRVKKNIKPSYLAIKASHT